MSKKHRHWGAAFLMATSAIGPGFLTQTTVFTVELGAAFAFVILLSVLLDLGAQLNIWQAVSASGRRAPELANALAPGLGHGLTVLIAVGGLAFNIGNIAGTGLGLEALTGLPVGWGAALSAGAAVGLFVLRDSGRALDWFARVLGLGMIALTAWVALSSHPPLAPVLKQAVWPDRLDYHAVVTLVGGTVGGYITFAGAHRLLDAGVRSAPEAGRGALRGILVATLMRLLLFLAAWGVVASGAPVDTANPPASVFRLAAGELGYRFFGLVMWAAAITSVAGATFTSLSFVTGSWPALKSREKMLAAVFIILSLGVFLTVGKPVKTLVFVGTLNGFILPVGLAVVLLAARRGLTGAYKPVPWLEAAGWAVVAVMTFFSVKIL